jgi:hypothetical protein
MAANWQRLTERELLTILLLVSATTAASQATSITEVDVGPYAQFTGPPLLSSPEDAGVVRWDTPDARDSLVEYGTTASLGLRATSSSPTTTHEIILNNLQYRTKYYYRVGYSSGAEELFTDVYTFDSAINYRGITESCGWTDRESGVSLRF